jgi:hypothetical protein
MTARRTRSSTSATEFLAPTGFRLSGCRAGACPASRQRGETIAIAYDPQQVSRVEVASRVAGWYPLLDPWVLGLALIGVGLLVAAAGDLVRGP